MSQPIEHRRSPILLIRIKKNPDGSAVLSATRPDGSTTWQRQTAEQAAFFVRHDLTHYAVETILSHRRGFYGLIADGWTFDDFSAPRPRDRFPVDTDRSEVIVGFFDAQREGPPWAAEEFNAHAARVYADFDAPNPPVLTEAQLHQIRASLAELLNRWQAVPAGATLDLPFAVGPMGLKTE